MLNATLRGLLAERESWQQARDAAARRVADLEDRIRETVEAFSPDLPDGEALVVERWVLHLDDIGLARRQMTIERGHLPFDWMTNAPAEPLEREGPQPLGTD